MAIVDISQDNIAIPSRACRVKRNLLMDDMKVLQKIIHIHAYKMKLHHTDYGKRLTIVLNLFIVMMMDAA